MKIKRKISSILSLVGVCMSVFLGTINLFATEQTANLLQIESEKNVKLNEVFSTVLTMTSHKKDAVIVIDTNDNYILNEEKTKENNQETIKSIQIDKTHKKIVFQLQNVSDTEDTKIAIYGQFTKEGEQSQRFYLENEGEDAQDYIWNVIASESTLQETTSSQQSESEPATEESEKISQNDSQSTTQKESSESTDDSISIKAGVPFPDSFDWDKLNTDGIDLSGFTEQTKNVPVKLSGGAFDKSQRNYHMFFGHVGQQNEYDNATNTFKTVGNVNAQIGKSQGLPLMSPMVIGTNKTNGNVKVIGYDYNNNDNAVGVSASTIDIGQLDSKGSTIVKSDSLVTRFTHKERIMKLYTKENEILAYGFILREGPKENVDTECMPVRVHGYVSDFKSGRVRYDISYLNQSNENRTYAMTYGLHVDIGGSHTNSKLYSNGPDGIYFDEPKVKGDGLPVRLYFYLGKSNYLGKNGPVDFKVGNLESGSKVTTATYNVGAWHSGNIDKQNWSVSPKPSYSNPYGKWDPIGKKGQRYNLSHPVFAYRWDPLLVKSGEVGTETLDISIKEPTSIEAEKSFKNLTSTDNLNHVHDNLQFQLVAKHTKGTIPWENTVISDVIPEGLEVDTSSIQLTTSDGQTTNLPATAYDKNNRTLKTDKLTISPSTSTTLTFKAKITKEAAGKSIINTMLVSDGQDEVTDDVSFKVEEQPGELTFISAPTQIDFGTHQISSQPLEAFGVAKGELKVLDDRKENGWKLNLKQTKRLTDGTIEMPDVLSFVTENGSSKITDADITISESDQKGETDLTDTLNGSNQRGIKATIPVEYQRVGHFSGTLSWTLEDVPTN